MSASTLTAWASGHVAIAAVLGGAALLAFALMVRASVRAARGVFSGTRPEDALTVVAALVATAVAMTGMWRFFGVVLGFSGPLRVLLFAFIELATLTSALRAKRNMSEHKTAGIDGLAMWALTGLSGVLSSLDSRSAAEAVFRLSAPLVAAWLWHRGLALERRRREGRQIHWRVTPERVLVRLGLADPTGTTTPEAAARYRIVRLARAAKRLRARTDSGAWAWRVDRAGRRLDRAMERAVEHAELATDQDRQGELLSQIGVMLTARQLAELDPPSPWGKVRSEPAELPEVPANGVLSQLPKAEAIRIALAHNDGAVIAAQKWLAERGVQADRAYMHDVKAGRAGRRRSRRTGLAALPAGKSGAA